MKASESTCGIARTMEVLGGKWTILIVRDLLTGSQRFSVLEHSLTGISPRTLATRLKELEEDGIVSRDCTSGHPVYSLTPAGRDLQTILDSMRDWGSLNSPQAETVSA